MVERRSEPRRRSILGGLVTYGRQCTLNCLVRNISDRGAMVVFPHTSVTPRQFTLHVPHRGRSYPARIVWRHADRAGLALGPGVPLHMPEDQARQARQRDAATMRRQLDPAIW